MDDSISRRDATQTTLEFIIEYLGGAFDEDLQKKLTERINALPSAQTDLDEWCTDCKEYDQEKHCCPRWNRVIRNTLKDAQPVRKRGKWKVCNILDYAQRPTGRKVGMCSQCGHLTDEFRTIVEASKKLTNFCSECGSYNREESDNG